MVCCEAYTSIDQIENEALVAIGFDYDSGMESEDSAFESDID